MREDALRIIQSVFPIGEKRADREIVEYLMLLCKPNEKFAEVVARSIGSYLRLYQRDRFNDYKYSERFNMFKWLHQLSVTTFEQVSG